MNLLEIKEILNQAHFDPGSPPKVEAYISGNQTEYEVSEIDLCHCEDNSITKTVVIKIKEV